MSRSRYAISAYNTALRTLPPLQVVVMLYDGALARMAGAAAAARCGDFEVQFKEAMRAAQILNGLNLCLNMKDGGKVARSLREMYEALCRALLSSVGRKPAAENFDRLGAALRATRDAWAEVAGVGAPALR